MTESLEREAAKVGLRISTGKTKIMRIGYAGGSNNSAPVTIGQIEQVDEFTYLGSVMANDGGGECDVECRIGKASAVFQRLYPICAATTISIKTKVRLFNSIVIPTAIYVAETWKTTAKITRRLNVFQKRCLQRILRVSYRDRITNDKVHRRTDTRPLQDVVTERRLRFAGHFLRLPPTRHAKKAILWKPISRQPQQGDPEPLGVTLSPRTSEPSAFHGTKPKPPQPIETVGEVLPPRRRRN
ncbi:hypothetical protein DPX16_7487 [Anabarilius grahami]|uniref:Uncharacterized protein n=1 Tax=Anabarilius grahami TaxID=495550 RepID=A0A3N0ZAU1_ANAGA|nr:hypothetical protein DPX16_7487 [Anabarilius grahami]